MQVTDPTFEALKAITRVDWMLHFEAIATAGNDEDSLAWDVSRVARH